MNYDITSFNTIMNWSFGIYTKLAEFAVPVAFAFGIGNLLCSTFLRVAFGGKLKFGGK